MIYQVELRSYETSKEERYAYFYVQTTSGIEAKTLLYHMRKITPYQIDLRLWSKNDVEMLPEGLSLLTIQELLKYVREYKFYKTVVVKTLIEEQRMKYWHTVDVFPEDTSVKMERNGDITFIKVLPPRGMAFSESYILNRLAENGLDVHVSCVGNIYAEGAYIEENGWIFKLIPVYDEVTKRVEV